MKRIGKNGYKIIDEFINHIYELIRLDMLYYGNTKLHDYYIGLSSHLYYSIISFYTDNVQRNTDNSFNVNGIHMKIDYNLDRNQYKLLKIINEGYVNLWLQKNRNN